MLSFKWTKAHAIYLPEIDAEHRNIFRMAEQLHKAAARGGDQELLTLVRAVLTATEVHFNREERLMRSLMYPLYGWHRQQHETVRKRGRELLTRIEAGEAGSVEMFLELLAGWLRDHISLADRMRGAYVRNYDRLHCAFAS
jgi:hemerythrin-like metal-binding protein